MTSLINSENRNGFFTCKIVYVNIFVLFNSVILFKNYLFSERLFSKYWPPGLYKNKWTFAINEPMVTHK